MIFYRFWSNLCDALWDHFFHHTFSRGQQASPECQNTKKTRILQNTGFWADYRFLHDITQKTCKIRKLRLEGSSTHWLNKLSIFALYFYVELFPKIYSFRNWFSRAVESASLVAKPYYTGFLGYFGVLQVFAHKTCNLYFWKSGFFTGFLAKIQVWPQNLYKNPFSYFSFPNESRKNRFFTGFPVFFYIT